MIWCSNPMLHEAMLNTKTLRSTRISAGISASLLAARAKVNRTRLSHIEHEYIHPTKEEILRLREALEQLIRARR